MSSCTQKLFKFSASVPQWPTGRQIPTRAIRQSRAIRNGGHHCACKKWRSPLRMQRSCCDRALGPTRDCVRRSIQLPTLSRSLTLDLFLPMRVPVLGSPTRPVWENSKQDGDPVTLMKITCDVNEIS